MNHSKPENRWKAETGQASVYQADLPITPYILLYAQPIRVSRADLGHRESLPYQLQHKQNLVTLCGKAFCFSLSFICPPPICPDSSRFFTSVILTTTLWDGIIIMFTLQMGKLSPSSIKELAQGCTGRKRLSWGPKFGQWDLNLSSFHNTQCLSLLLWGWGEKVPWANISSCPTPEITAMLGQVPGTCELGASCS